MAKKRFLGGIPKNIEQGLTDVIDIEENIQTGFNDIVILLKDVEPDPNNPRTLEITKDEIMRGSLDIQKLSGHKREQYQSLCELAESIKEHGLLQPIIVYKFGSKYRIVIGERRTLASLLAGNTTIEAKVFNIKPSALELDLIQWTENIDRDDLPLRDRVKNITNIINSFQLQHNNSGDINATELSKLIKKSLAQASAYLVVIKGPDDVLHAVMSGKINNLEKANLIAKITNDEERRVTMDNLVNYSLKDIQGYVKQLTTQKTIQTNKVRGRIKTTIKLGSTKRVPVVKKIIQTVLNAPELEKYAVKFNMINWSDLVAVNNAFNEFIKLLEKECRNELV
jgi:ParB family chromosome partitioning protein